MSDEIDVAKLKVPELRAELSKRGLNTFGTRQVLVDRLSEAIGSANQSSTSKDSQSMDADEPPCIVSPVKNSSQESIEQNCRNDGKPVGVENGMFDKNMDIDSRQRSDSDLKRRRSSSRSPRRRSRSRSRDRDRDGRRSPRKRSRSPTSKNKICDEPDGWENKQAVFLDGYNCDLNLIIDADGFSARPQTDGGFSMMWAGVRANYGLIQGRAFFEVRITKHISVENLDSMAGGAAHVMRVGWSTENSEFALGEEPQSYGYGGTGKKSCDNKFSNYGCTFGEGDVVGAFLEYTSTDAIMRFSVNGVDQGECFRVQKSTFSDRPALFPHIYVKNVEFSVNFGQNEQPAWFAPNIPGDSAPWNLMDTVDAASKVHGRLPPASKSECEAIMMIGLPGSGKTHYAEKLRADNREKQYNVLGTNLILDKMKVMGLARQRNYHGRWDVLIDKATKCLNVLIGIASMRRRNYILDQTNVYPSAQRRKMRPFEGFKRQAIVIVPTDEEFRRRIAQREKEEGKEVPESAVLEMKANFGIPKPLSEDPTSVFDDVILTELGSTEARDLVQKYNEEGQANRPPPEKRQRWDGSSRDRDTSGSRDSRFHSGHDRDRDYSHGRRDDYRRSPNRRDDRGRRDYRGGYCAERDRSRDSDRYGRGRDRDSYGRPHGGRFGGPGGPVGRFGGPPGRGGYPPGMGPSGGYMGYDGPRGGMMMRGGPGRGGPPGSGMGRGGYGGPSFDPAGGPPMDFRGDGRPPRGGRGGFRGGPPDHGGGPTGNYGGPMDSGYSGRPTRFDNPVGKPEVPDAYGSGSGGAVPVPVADGSSGTEGAPGAGGYRGGYGGPPGRGAYAPPDSRGGFGQGSGQPPTRGGMAGPPRGAPTGRVDPDGYSVGRGGGPMSRGGRGGRGGYSNDSESGSGYPGGSDSTQYSRYPGGSDNYSSGPSGYSTGDDYNNPSRDRFGPSGATSYPGPGGPVKSESTNYQGSSGYSGGYQKSGYPPSGSYAGNEQSGYSRSSNFPTPTGGYPTQSAGYTGAASGYPTNPPGSFSGTTSETYSGSGGRPGGDIRRSGTQPATSSAYGSSDGDKSAPGRQTSTDASSLYASGAARFGERPGTQASAPRQSRFDDKSSAVSAQQPYSGYPPGNYQSGAYGTYGGATNPPAPGAPTGSRSGRSRFDVGPGSGQQAPPSVPGASATGGTSSVQSTIPQSTGVMQQQTSQSYGYNYPPPASKPDTTTGQPSQQQSAYSSYNYGYGYGSYGTQGASGASSQQRPTTGSGSTTQSLYASAVAENPQSSSAAQSAAPTDSSASANAAYASYYGYGSQSASGSASTATAPGAPGQPGKYDAAMAAAQQFNAWQQQQPVTASVSGTLETTPATATPAQSTQGAATAAAAYANYYPGYAAYGAGYGTAAPTTGTAPVVSSTPSVPQYYAGYR